MGREFELKYKVEARELPVISELFPENAEHISMKTTYYDTPGGDLSARRWTLRRRLEDGVPVCTVKTPQGSFGRGEWEVECGDILEAVPALCRLGCPTRLAELTAGGLVPLCGAEFIRIRYLRRIPGATVELALDQGILTGGSKSLPFTELEVELKSGTEGAVLAFCRELEGRYDLSPEPKGKFFRAMELGKEW